MKRSSLALLAALLLATTACGEATETPIAQTETPAPKEGPTITVASFNFTESEILGGIYGQALEAEGYPVEFKLNLGSREVIFPALESGEIDFLPEYIGSSLATGFTAEAPTDRDEALQMLEERFTEMGVTVLEPADAQDKNVFVVTREFAEEHDVSTVEDLKDVEGTVTLGGPPECEERTTCLVGLRDTYGIDNLEFESIQEAGARSAALDQGTIDVNLMFSTDALLKAKGEEWVVLSGDEEIIPPENVVPVVRTEIVDAYGEEFTTFVNSITAELTTDLLIDLNAQVDVEGGDADDVARGWLEEEGFLS